MSTTARLRSPLRVRRPRAPEADRAAAVAAADNGVRSETASVRRAVAKVSVEGAVAEVSARHAAKVVRARHAAKVVRARHVTGRVGAGPRDKANEAMVRRNGALADGVSVHGRADRDAGTRIRRRHEFEVERRRGACRWER